MKGNHTDEYIVSAVIGSASVPFFFPPRNMSQFGEPYLLMDGGSSWNTNIVSGINECLQMEGITSQSQIDLDVIVLDPVIEPTDIRRSEHNTLANYLRRDEINSFFNAEDSIQGFVEANPEVNYRYFIQSATTLLHDWEILEFGNDYTLPLIEKGKVDAAAAISAGPGVKFAELMQKQNRKYQKM